MSPPPTWVQRHILIFSVCQVSYCTTSRPINSPGILLKVKALHALKSMSEQDFKGKRSQDVLISLLLKELNFCKKWHLDVSQLNICVSMRVTGVCTPASFNSAAPALEFVFPLGAVHLGRCEYSGHTWAHTKSRPNKVMSECCQTNSGAVRLWR